MEENKFEEDKKEKKKGIKFFKKIWYSVVKFDKYMEMAMEGAKKANKYLVKLVLLMALIVSIVGVYNTNKTLDEGLKYISEEIQDFSYKNNELNMEIDEVMRVKGTIFNLGNIIIDMTTEDESIIDGYKSEIAESEEGTGIIILKNKIIQVANSNATEEPQTTELTYSYIATTLLGNSSAEFTKDDIVSFLNGTGRTYVIVVNFFIYLISYFITYIISTIIYVLLLVVIGSISALVTRIKMKMSLIYSISVYALTLPNILSLVYFIARYSAGIQIKYFDIAYIAIAYIYLITVIFLIKTDLMRKQEQPVEEIKKEENKEDNKELNEQQNEESNDEKDEKQSENKSEEPNEGEI